MFSLPHLMREAERTLEQRRDAYPRLVVEGRMDAAQAMLRLDQTEAIVDALYVMHGADEELLREYRLRVETRMERRRKLMERS